MTRHGTNPRGTDDTRAEPPEGRDAENVDRGERSLGAEVLLLVPGLAAVFYALFWLEPGTLPYHGLTAAGVLYLASLFAAEAVRQRSLKIGFASLGLLVTAALNLQRGLVERPSLWLLGLTGGLFLGVLVGSFVVILHQYRRQQDERERRLISEAGSLAFAATMLVSLVFWVLERLPDARGDLSRLAFDVPDPSPIWVVFFGLGIWIVAWSVLRWRRY